MKRFLLAVLLVMALASGCGEDALPPPQVVSISPAMVLASDANAVTVLVKGVLPTTVDYDRSSQTVAPSVSLLVGTLAVGTGAWEPGGKLSAVVPSLLAPGAYDVQVSFADGRMGVLPEAYQVTPGHWPDGFTVDPIPAQHAGVPFKVTLHATGADGPAFNGNVMLHVTNASAIKPSLSEPFVQGALTQTVTIPLAANGAVVNVVDLEGHLGVSKAFDVLP